MGILGAMIKLKPETITALRDRLRDRGAPASVARPDINIADAESTLLLEEYGPLCEVMFLMMGADGSVEQSERDVIRGALRELDDRIRTAHFGAMLRSAESALAEHGQIARVQAIAGALRDDPVRGEVAFVLAAAVAFADDRIAPDENAFLNDLADALGIDDARSEDLMRLLLRLSAEAG